MVKTKRTFSYLLLLVLEKKKVKQKGHKLGKMGRINQAEAKNGNDHLYESKSRPSLSGAV